ncbi:MAG: hypothetical protein JKY50_00230 [Oleispira sp.]|nr:hypothetical protein [Oleispira sp.]
MSRKIIGFIEGGTGDSYRKTGERYIFCGGGKVKDKTGKIVPSGWGSTTGLTPDRIIKMGDTPIYATPDIKVLQEARDLLAYKKSIKPKYLIYGRFNGKGKLYTWMCKDQLNRHTIASPDYEDVIISEGYDIVQVFVDNNMYQDEETARTREMLLAGKIKTLRVEKVLDK